MKRHPRQEELLTQRALQGLSDAEQMELRALGGEGDEGLELAAAALHLSALPHEALPHHVAARIMSGQPPRGAPAPVARKAPARWPGWLAAAACLALAAGAWVWAVRRPPRIVRVEATVPSAVASVAAPKTVEQERDALLAAPDVQTLAWKATKDPAGASASGDVVWSNAEQRGFMRFVGLAPNDPVHAQYQLWIFDKDRDARFPVDGGVFDMSAGGEVVVPITAKLHVDTPTLFAVTVEKPGGVVVSKRERIVVTAG